MGKWVIGALLFFTTACASNEWRQREFDAIEIGMPKSEVLHIAGPPAWSDRMKGEDRWIYYMDPKNKKTEQLVYFRDGQVTYKGPRKKPFLSADEMDALKQRAPKPTYIHKKKYSDEQLRKLIKKEIKKEKSKEESI